MRSDNAPRRSSAPSARGLLAAVAALAVVWAACAHSPDGQKLVGDPVSEQTREQIHLGRDKMIGAMASFIQDLDRQVCRGREGRMATRKRQQALSEAYLEVMRAIEQSERAATPNDQRTADDEIVWMKLDSPGPEAGSSIQWQCRNADEHERCVQSTANSVARLLYRSKFEGYSLEPDRKADLLAAAGADLEWALGIARRATDTRPGEAIASQCRDGESPLKTYLANTDGESLRAIRDGLVGGHDDFCAGLAATYLDVIDSLRAHFEQGLISRRCPVREWSPIDE